MKNFLGEGRGVETASALASPKAESGATDTLGYANNKREAEASLLLLCVNTYFDTISVHPIKIAYSYEKCVQAN